MIYAKPKSGAMVPEGEWLGQMKREMENRKIVEFIAAGPKNYALRHTDQNGHNEMTDAKIRGFTLHYNSPLTFQNVKQMVFNHYRDGY